MRQEIKIYAAILHVTSQRAELKCYKSGAFEIMTPERFENTGEERSSE